MKKLLIFLLLLVACSSIDVDIGNNDFKSDNAYSDEVYEDDYNDGVYESDYENAYEIDYGTEDVKMGKVVLLKTNHGDIKIELASDMPITVGNFEKLVGEGFYDGVIFHRVIDGFMIQGGDPDGTGMGGPGYKIKDEFTDHNKNDRGTISMANAGPNTGGSQFFINLVNNNFLDTKHPVFGKVVDGMDVVDAIANVPKGSGDRPVEDVVIEKASVE